MRTLLVVTLAMFSVFAASQTAPAASPSAPAAAPADPELASLLSQIQSTSQLATADIEALRIDKWKADRAVKEQSEARAQALVRNMTQALPTIVQETQAAPASLAATFKLYRNVDALHDVLASLAESAGAFGKREDFDALARHVSALDSIRRSLGDRLERMTAARDAEVARLRGNSAPASSTAKGPRRIVVGDDPPQKTRKPKQ
jgi:hypothetical protein